MILVDNHRYRHPLLNVVCLLPGYTVQSSQSDKTVTTLTTISPYQEMHNYSAGKKAKIVQAD